METAALLGVIVKVQGAVVAAGQLQAVEAAGAKAAMTLGRTSSATRAYSTASGVAARQTQAHTKAQDDHRKSTDRSTKATGGLTRKMAGFAPIAALAGAAVVGMGTQFDDSMQRIVSLVGVSQKQVNAWKGDIRGLAIETAKSPRELADALYFLTSAGLSNSDAFAALRISAKASSAGLGDMAKIADAVSSAMNAYGPKVMSAAKATDILVATAKAGKAEPEELASAMGRVLPIASQLGVVFTDVGGAVAQLSLKGLNAAESVTAVRQMLQAMLKPTKQAKELLASLGLSADDVRASLKQRGLLDTLMTLRKKLGGNTEALAVLFPQVEGLNGVLSMTAKGGEQAAKTIGNVERHTGLTSKAFEEAKTAGFRFRQLLAVLESAGGLLAGVLGKLIGFFADNRTALSALLVVLGMAGAGFLAFKVAAVTAALASGGLAGAFAAVTAAMMANPIFAVVAAVAALAAGLVILWNRCETFREVVISVFNAVKDFVEKWWRVLLAVMTGGLSLVVEAVIDNWDNVKRVTSAVWNVIKTVVLAVWSVLRDTAKVVFPVIKAVVTTAWDAIKAITSTVWKVISTVLGVAWSALSAAATTTFQAIKTVVTTAWNAVRTVTSTVWSAIRTALGAAWDGIKTVATTAWEAVKVAILTPIRAARDVLGDIWDGLKKGAKGAFDAIVGFATGFGDKVKNAITSAFTGVANLVIGFINTIIGVITRIPGVKIGKIPKLAKGGTIGRTVDTAGSAVQALARGGVVRRPMAIVGEEGPRHPEFVIPTNPAYRDRALGLYNRLGKELGVAGSHNDRMGGLGDSIGNAIRGPASAAAGLFSGGGGELFNLLKGGANALIKLLPGVGDLPGWLRGMGGYVLDKATEFIKDKVQGLVGTAGGAVSLDNVAKLAMEKFGLVVTSGFRPGDDGWHGQNRARDLAGPAGAMRAFAQFMLGLAPSLLELIHTPLGVGVKNGSVVPIASFGTDVMADHLDHVHIAMAMGGLLHRNGWVLDSYAKGTDWVPQTGPYLLHRGESVVNADDNRRRGDGPLVNIERFYAGGMSENTVAARLAWLADNA